MTRMMKISLSFGVGLIGLFALSVTLTGCSGESTNAVDQVKINNMTPGEYRDSVDPEPKKGKATKGLARPKR